MRVTVIIFFKKLEDSRVDTFPLYEITYLNVHTDGNANDLCGNETTTGTKKKKQNKKRFFFFFFMKADVLSQSSLLPRIRVKKLSSFSHSFYISP